ncbi:MAG: dipeptide epimerase [Ferruginibacter sp.]|nr:dipeptide epimerase [Ferruginibacter sp.]
MIIEKIQIYKYSIPMYPFTIATGTMEYAQNILIKIFTNSTIVGIGECSAFPMIVGETQNTCYEMAKDFANLWKGKNALNLEERLNELHLFTAGNSTIKSAFDMALYDIAAKNAHIPLYKFLGGEYKEMLSDITVGIGLPETMAMQAKTFVNNGAAILKVKLGKDVVTDVARIKEIRAAIGNNCKLRIDANQGWSFEDAKDALTQLGQYNIEFCEQPMRTYNDDLLPELMKLSSIKIMADESVYNHYDAKRIIKNNACHYINIKFAKSGGIHEAKKIIEVATKSNIACMMGGMLESRVALTAFAHFAAANTQIVFYDMDTCMLGHKADPVIGGVTYKGYTVQLPNGIGIGASVDESFLNNCESVII